MIFQFALFGSGGIDPTTINAESFYEVIFRFIEIALGLIGAIAVVYIIIAGIQYIMAGGVEAQQAESKRAIQAAIIGLILVLLSFTITNLVLREFRFRDTILNEYPEIQKITK